MSRVADLARVAVVLSDYAAADAAGKTNILGAGWAVTAVNPETGTVPPQTLVVLLDFPPELYGEDFSLSIALRDETEDPVQLPGPAGVLQPMRIGQILRVEEPTFMPGAGIPRNKVWAHAQTAFNLSNGLPLPANQMYTWTVEIDGTQKPEWAASFFVAGPPPSPVIG